MKVTMNPILLLVLGVVLMLASHMTLSIALFAWVAYVPFLLYLHRTTGWKSRLGFFLAYLIAWSLIVGKITTAPLSVAMIPLFSLPISFFHLPAFLLWARWRHRKGGHLLFPAVMVVMEWVQYTFTPFASWGVAAYTQMDQVGLMQSVSLFGMGGLSFLIYWINVELAQFLSQKEAQVRRLMIPAMVLAGVMVFGAIRYDVGKMKGTNTIKVAAVGTDSQVDGSSLPPDEIRQANAARLFARTRQAALGHAKLIVWNEGAAAVLPEEEEAWKDSLSHLAQSCQASLVAAYVVPISENPLRYENKYQFYLADGSLAATYYKHEPVPGEPAIKGTSPFVAHEIQGLKVGGAICYDYDFPYIARGLGKQGVDLVALPSSDWRGIDPIHTQMAAFRAVEQGHSVLRSTRFGLSAAITPYGEMRAQMSSFDDNDKIMIAHLPASGAFSLYAYLGDVLVYLCIAYVLGFGVRQLVSKKATYIATSPLTEKVE